MLVDRIGFIGAGRITRILLGGLERADRLPGEVVVSDTDERVIQALRKDFPKTQVVMGDYHLSASQRLVFLALHPPAIPACLKNITGCLREEAVLVSLAPKITIQQLSDGLGGFRRIIRMLPNAPSILNTGYNPVAFSNAFSPAEKDQWLAWFQIWGESPEVLEDKLEAYAIITAMGPTYLWFQLYELLDIAKSFGMEESEAVSGISSMAVGAVRCMSAPDMRADQVMDLIPVKPLSEAEAGIREIYQHNLVSLFNKLKA